MGTGEGENCSSAEEMDGGWGKGATIQLSGRVGNSKYLKVLYPPT